MNDNQNAVSGHPGVVDVLPNSLKLEAFSCTYSNDGRCIDWIMDADDSMDEWSSEDQCDRQLSNNSSLNTQSARDARLATQRQQRPANRTLSFVPYLDWDLL